MTKDQIIHEIMLNSNQFTKGELKKKRKSELEKILSEAITVDYGDDYEDTFEGERQLVESVTHPYDDDFPEPIFEEVEEEEVEEEVVIDISKLSKYEQKTYARTGRLPDITINRYSRFDKESPNKNF